MVAFGLASFCMCTIHAVNDIFNHIQWFADDLFFLLLHFTGALQLLLMGKQK